MTIKQRLRKYGALVRSGRATESDAMELARAQRAFDYLCERKQRGQRREIHGWWDLPVAARMWASDARDSNAI